MFSFPHTGVYVLAYINPNLNIEGHLFKEADTLDYFVKNSTGDTYVVNYGEFYCGIIDLTNPEATEWYKNRVIRENMIDFGFGGWMADFGEYLPTDGVFHSGESGEVLHNRWPALWAQVNGIFLETLQTPHHIITKTTLLGRFLVVMEMSRVV